MKTEWRAKFLALLLMGFGLFAPSTGYPKATFGAEFNFSNRQLNDAPESDWAIRVHFAEQMRDQVMQRCPECKVEKVVGAFRVTYPDGWYFEIGTDPGVVEVQTKPSTTDEIHRNLERMQSHIFQSAAAAGLRPASQIMGRDWAGSHIHVGVLSALGGGKKALRRLRNFIADFSSHPELAQGIFTDDSKNAPPLAALEEKQRKAFRKLLKKVDRGEITSLEEFAQKLRRKVYYRTVEGDFLSEKFQAFNVNRIGNPAFDLLLQTFELRAMPDQQSARDYFLLTVLIESRLDYLDGLESPVKFKKGTSLPTSDEARVEGFYRYVTETGLDFALYEHFLMPRQRELLPGIKHKVGPVKIRCESMAY